MIAELYPQAWAHLDAARRARADLGLSWSDLLGAGLADFSVITNPDGTGCIVAYANWPHDARAQLTDKFETCIKQLWACLDSLVVESVDMFSILKRPRYPDRPRYLPIADCSENFDALLVESCLDGVLQLQADMIWNCQPFQRDPEDESIERFRSGIRQLLDWSNRIEDGSHVGAWATPVEPQVHVEAPTKLVHLEAQAPVSLKTSE